MGVADQARGQRTCALIGCCNQVDEDGTRRRRGGLSCCRSSGDERLCSKVMFRVRAFREHVG